MPSSTDTTAGSGTTYTSRPPCTSCSQRAWPSSTDRAFSPVTIGRPNACATRIPTWYPPESADSLPKITKSNGPPEPSSEAMAATTAEAVPCGSHSSLLSLTSNKPRSAPTASMSRTCSSASGGPSVRTVTEPPCASTSRTASSTPHSS